MYKIQLLLGNILPTVNAAGDVDKEVVFKSCVKFPGIYVKSFKEIFEEFMDKAAGFDKKTHMPIKGGGLFGFRSTGSPSLTATRRKFRN